MKEEALKLADELQEYMTSLGWKTHQAPAMIRRLVEELDEKNYRILELTKKYKALTWNDKQGEPIAWMKIVTDEDGQFRVYVDEEPEWDDSCIPLYATPQTKPLRDDNPFAKALRNAEALKIQPLSDEDIDKEATIKMNQILMDLIDSEDWNKGCTKQHLVNFARAIEERHGIK
jgi:hypothetical protein